ncbi:MAG: outer membrane beta-barrel protein [Pirellulales bacterium]
MLRRSWIVAALAVALLFELTHSSVAQSIPDVAPEPRAGSNDKRLVWRNKAKSAASNAAENPPAILADAPAKPIATRATAPTIDDDPPAFELRGEAPVVKSVTRVSASSKPSARRPTPLEDPTTEPPPGSDGAIDGDFPPQLLRTPNGGSRLIPPAPAADDPWKVAPPVRSPVDPVQPRPYPGGPVPAQYEQGAPPDEVWGLPRTFEKTPYPRFEGRGEPLTAGSWLNRPYYFGIFVGGLSGDTLIQNQVNQNAGVLGGFRFGWDYDHYWGIEMRGGFASQGLEFSQYPTLDGRSNDLIFWDFNLVYYPWGDSRWRPYASLGIGIADYDFVNEIGIRRSEMVFAMPIAAGLKYRMNQYWTWRFDVADNIIFGGTASFETQNQLSFTTGLELRFGGTRRSYWPWNPSNRYR